MSFLLAIFSLSLSGGYGREGGRGERGCQRRIYRTENGAKHDVPLMFLDCLTSSNDFVS